MKLFETARIAGKVVEFAATKAAYEAMSKRRLNVEFRRLQKELLELTNKGASFPIKEHSRLVAEMKLVRELL